MTEKKYQISPFERIFSLGLWKYGAKIAGNTLYVYHRKIFRPVKVAIENITEIYCGIDIGCVYAITLSSGDGISIPMVFFEGPVCQQLLHDLKALNPNIVFDEYILTFMKEDLSQKKPVRFDFEVPKRDSWEGIQPLMERPSLTASIMTLSVLVPAFMTLAGAAFLVSVKGNPVPDFNMILSVIAGMSLGIAPANIILSLASLYGGHKVTVIAVVLSVVFMAMALLI